VTGMSRKKNARKISGLGRILAHRRLLMFWVTAAVALTGPWTLKGCSVPTRVRDDCRVLSVHDGDTLRAECHGEKLKVRLYCIDAPEMEQRPWGTESRDALRELLPQDTSVRLEIHDKDKYGRYVAEVFSDGDNRNRRMVRTGQAAVYADYCPLTRFGYYQDESAAREHMSGIWGKPGLQQRPWEWRQHAVH
jgi:endonuclease YncB( thermonuclease family)